MAEPTNLIQVQSRLQDPTVTTQDLLKYANGSNPEVPSFLALLEMNRRKQIEDSTKAFQNSAQASVKDQIASQLTKPTQMANNPTANPFAKDITAAPTGIAPTAAPTGIDMTQAKPGINPTAAPAMPNTAPIAPIQAADGGLMSLPVNHFNSNNYAGGGIVAFAKGDLVNEQKQLSSFPEERDPGAQTMSDAAIEAALRSTPVEQPAPSGAPSEYQKILSGLPSLQAPVEKTAEELYAEKKARDKMAGVSEDPYAELKKREATREARQQKNYEQYGMDRLLAQLGAFATADPSRGFGYAGAESAKASANLEKEQNIIRDKEEAAQIEFQRAIAKEEDARRRNDSDAVKAAQDAQLKAKLDIQKLENDRATLAAHIYNYENTGKYQEGMLGYYGRMASSAEASKPTADDKKIQKADALTNQDPQYKIEASRLSSKEGAEPGSPEYNATIMRMYEIQKRHYIAQGLPPPPPPVLSETPAGPASKPGFLDRLFGSNRPAANTMPPGWTVQTNP